MVLKVASSKQGRSSHLHRDSPYQNHLIAVCDRTGLRFFAVCALKPGKCVSD